MAIDPICGMTVDPARAAGTSERDGVAYYFCSLGCKKRFDEGVSEPPLPVEMGAEYICPMHPEVRQIGPGTCPKCGMGLEPVEAGVANPELTDMSRRFAISLLFTVPLLAFMFWPVSHWVEMALATPVVFWCGWPLFVRAWDSLKHRSLNMFTLIALGAGTAYVSSFFGKDYFEPAAVIVTLVLLGQVLELRARAKTGSAIQALMGLAPATARLVADDGEHDVALASVKPGNRIPGSSR